MADLKRAGEPAPGVSAGAAPEGSSGRPRRGGWALLLRLFQVALTVFVTWLVIDRLGPGVGALAAAEPGLLVPRWGWITASCVVLAAGYAFSGLIWGRMVVDLGGPELAPLESIRIYLVANLGRYVPGKLWQIAGLALLARSRGVSPSVATAAAVVGQAVALAGATLVGLLALRGAGPAVAGWAPWALVGTLVVALVVTVPPIFRPLVRLWLRWVPGDTPEDVQVGGLQGIRWLSLYTLNWMVYAFAFFLLVRGLSLPGGPLAVGPAFAAAYVIGYLMLFAPAGLGVREGFLVAFLAPVVGAGAAALVAVAARVWTTTVEVIPAGAFWMAGMRRPAISSGESSR